MLYIEEKTCENKIPGNVSTAHQESLEIPKNVKTESSHDEARVKLPGCPTAIRIFTVIHLQ